MNDAEKLQTLRDHQAWRRDVSDTPRKPMPDPKEIGKALDWAIMELEKAKRGPVCTTKRTP